MESSEYLTARRKLIGAITASGNIQLDNRVISTEEGSTKRGFI